MSISGLVIFSSAAHHKIMPWVVQEEMCLVYAPERLSDPSSTCVQEEMCLAPLPDSDSAAPLILHNADELYDSST
ncbi:hypothetical protein Tco_0419745, partial [Tanacetum coccineum]